MPTNLVVHEQLIGQDIFPILAQEECSLMAVKSLPLHPILSQLEEVHVVYKSQF
jgi:hypothetical protein